MPIHSLIRTCAPLTSANRAGWKSFLARNRLYPRLATLALCAVLLCLTAPARAESSALPSAPTPHPVFTSTDWGISAALVASHVGDYLSTEQCVHGNRCHEATLPQFLVHRNGLFAVYEATTASLEVLGVYELAKRGHPRLARVVQTVNIGLTARTVANNYEFSWHTHRP